MAPCGPKSAAARSPGGLIQGDDGEWYAAPPPPPGTPQEGAEVYLRTGQVTPALTADFGLWLDLHGAGLDWRAYTGGRRIPRWRLRLDAEYRAVYHRIASERP